VSSAWRRVGAGVVVGLALVAVGVMAGAVPANGQARYATPGPTAIEDRYQAAGPWAVSSRPVTDAAGATYVVFHPTDLGTGDHPILTWANGSSATPADYEGLLTHLASWGFVVIASDSGQTGWGTEALAGAIYMVGENGDPASPFHHKLDTAHVGALGHSQGATGAVNATIMSDGLITSTVAVNFVDPIWFNPASQMPDFDRLTAPVFFATGVSDILSTALAQRAYYDRVPGAAARAGLAGAGHTTIQQPANGFLGYVTAWLRYTLEGDPVARAAFLSSGGDGRPEIETNARWQNQATKNLP
jgi:Chlorophyllase enzyme